jgi:putative FmdB family regulatory protein
MTSVAAPPRRQAVPLYEYKCRKCVHTFEKIMKFSDNPAADCPKCGSEGERQLSAPAVHFKGSGWYVTDYARKGQKDSDSEAKKTSSDESKSSEPKSEKSSDSKSKKSSDKPKKKD